MAINQEYFGSQETWATATTESLNQQFEFKVANWNPNDSTIGKGDYKYKFGQLFNETGEYVIDLDISTAYCAMDSNAPFVHRLYTSARYDSTRYHSRIDLAPTTDTPIGWYAGSIPDYMVILPEGYATDLAPVNFKPLWEDPAWHPTIGTSNGQRTLGYIGSANSPVLSFPFKNIKLVPVIRCCAFKAGKTKTDLDNAITYTDFASVVDLSSEKFVPLGTYLNDSYSGTPFYEAFPIICSLYVAPVLLYFDNDGNLAIPPSCRFKYNSTAMRSYGNMREALHVDIFPTDKVDFTELISRYGTVYDDASCDVRLFPTRRIPTNYVYYNYNGNSYPQKSLDVYEQGAFCIGGRCAGNSNNYNFMYIRAIDPDTFKVYADTDDADIDCGALVDDFGTLDDFRDYVRKSVAYFGMFFTDDIEPAVEETSTMDTQGLFLGIVDENGITHGTYSEGTENRDQTNYDWEDPMDDTPWTPGGGGDEGDLESDDEDFNPATRPDWNTNMESSGYNCYVITTPATMKEITDNLMDPSLWDSFMNLLFNPVQCIVACHLMPANLSPSARGADTDYVYASIVKLTSEKVPIFDNVYTTYNVGTVDLKGYTKDFMDYNYTTVLINLPYVGMKELDIEACMDGSISVMYQSDALSGDCTATVWVKDRFGHSHYRYEFKGNCARRIPFGSYTSPIASGIMSVGKGVVQAAMAFLTGGLSDAGAAVTAAGGFSGMSGGWGTQISEFLASDFGRLSTINAIGKGVGTMGSGLSGLKGGATTGNNASGGAVTSPVNTDCYLIIPRPKQSRPNNYLELDGKPSDKAGQVKDFTGYFAAKSIKFDGIGCTMDERSEIQQLLMAGIYI